MTGTCQAHDSFDRFRTIQTRRLMRASNLIDERFGHRRKTHRIGDRPILTDGAEKPVESSTPEVLKGSGLVQLPASGTTSLNTGQREVGEVKINLTALQQM